MTVMFPAFSAGEIAALKALAAARAATPAPTPAPAPVVPVGAAGMVQTFDYLPSRDGVGL